ncbi:MAG: NADH-quinone oxidoreductase subunit L [Pirellulales bacterium]
MFDLTRIQWMLVLIPALPLAAAVMTAALGPKLLRGRSHWPTILALAGSLVCSLVLAMDVARESRAVHDAGTAAVGWEQTVDLWVWAKVDDAHRAPADAPTAGGGDLDIRVTLRADALTAMMLCMVTFVSLLVAIYSSGYMHGERGYWRFFSYVALFVFSMTMLVSVSNFVLLYVFWEAVGVCSYLLIGFWYEKPSAANAGKKAFLVNRVGDFGFALGVFLIWVYYGTLNFHDTAAAAGVLGQTRLTDPSLYVGGGVGLAICLLLMVGACGKSAQFPLHVWLPDAMEGPTPVSALIHAATMVTAGVYMVVRTAPLYLVSAQAQLVVSVIGCATALMAAIIAVTQTDLKRILAYSTISQLGYMFLGVGTGTLLGITAGMFHLFTHAFFKALLFLGAGSVMHAMGGVIDIRRFGGLRRLMPWTHWTFLFGCLALAGFPFTAGYFSKDAVLAAVHDRGHGDIYTVLYYLAIGTAFLTAMYTFRAFFLTFYGREEIPAEAGHHAHESPRSMTIPLAILAVFALGVGWLGDSFGEFIGSAPSLSYVAAAMPQAEAHADHTVVALTSSVVVLLGIGLAAFLYLGDQRLVQSLTRVFKPAYIVSHGKFFIDPIYRLLFVWPALALAWVSAWLDRYIVDGLVNLIGKVPLGVGAALRGMQTGMVQLYAMLMVLGLLALFGSLFL